MTTESEQLSRSSPYPSEDASIRTRFVPVPRFSKWTLKSPAMRNWVESNLEGRVLNACCGDTRLNHDGEVVRNDLDTEIDADYHVDAAELAAHLEPESFDTIFFDPPWSTYQSNLRYDGRHVRKEGTDIDLDTLPFTIKGGREKQQLGHARLAKEGFNYLLKPGGRVIEITFHGTCMPARLGFKRIERVIFDPVGEGKCVIGSVDQKMQTQLAV